MGKGISEELREAIFEAARAGVAEAAQAASGDYVNYFKAMETLLYNYKRLAALVEDKDAYCEVEYHAGRKTFAASPRSSGYAEYPRTEADIVAEMREDRERRYAETVHGFERLEKAIRLFREQKEFVVIRLYYFGEDIDGQQRADGKTATWEEVAAILEDAGILKEVKTARRWRNKIVNDMAVCVFGVPAAISAGTFRNNRSGNDQNMTTT